MSSRVVSVTLCDGSSTPITFVDYELHSAKVILLRESRRALEMSRYVPGVVVKMFQSYQIQISVLATCLLTAHCNESAIHPVDFFS